MGVGQPIRISFLPEFEGEAARYEDFFCRLVAVVSPPLIRCSRASEQSAVLRSANPWNRLPAMPIKLNDSNFGCFFSSRKERRNRTDSSNARRPATGRVLERCYW